MSVVPPVRPERSARSLLPLLVILTVLVVLLACGSVAYVAWMHPEVVAPFTLVLGTLGVLAPLLLAGWKHR
ncbi:hypothetical protein AB0957_18245 [Streptomyces zhihengii]|uniref:hypothetical protein n=1 Tax=Streptomyces zhihengii TaxID=1818004 RepID=UPI003455BC18